MDQSSEGSSAAVEAADVDLLTTTYVNTPDRLSHQITQSFLKGRRVSSSSPSLTVDSGLCSNSEPSSPTKEMSPVPVPVAFQQQSTHRHSPTIQIVARQKIQQFNTDLHDGKWKKSPESVKRGHSSDEAIYGRGDLSSNRTNHSFSNAFSSFQKPDTIIHNQFSVPPLQKPDEVTEAMRMGPCDESDCLKSLNMETDKKVYPMAFTVDFGDTDTKKSLEISDSISKFAPRHRRNLSLTKANDELMGKKGDEDSSQISLDTTMKIKNSLRKGSLGHELGNESTPTKLISNNSFSTFNNSTKSTSSSTILPTSRRNLPAEDRKSRRISSLAKLPNRPTAMEIKDISNNNHLRLDSLEKSPSSGKSLLNVHDDNASETGTYTVEKESAEVRKARKVIDKAVETLHEDTSQEGALGWVREWAEQASQQRISPDTNLESETQCLLYDTENLVDRMQKRVSRRLSGKKIGTIDSDEEAASNANTNATHHKVQHNGRSRDKYLSTSSPLFREGSVLSDSGYALGYASDSSNEGCSRELKNPVKYNRAFAIRRNRVVGYDSDGCANRQSMTLPMRGVSPRPQQHGPNLNNTVTALKSTSPAPFSRTDGGRFSLRVPSKSKSKLPPYQQKEIQSSTNNWQKLDECSKMYSSIQSNSEIAMKKQTTQQSFFNNGRKGLGGTRSNSTLTAKEVELANWKRRKNYDPMKSASNSNYGKKKDVAEKFCGSGSESPTEEVLQRVRAPLVKSPLANPSSFASHSHSNAYYNNNMSANSEEDDSNEIASTHSSSSPTSLQMSRSVHDETHSHQSIARSKNKLEALDSLVISTIHSLSVKVRTCSRQLLEKLQVHYNADENGALLEEMVSQLRDLENTTSPAKSTSRELSGTLKNLKKIEQVILVLDRVLCEDAESDPAS